MEQLPIACTLQPGEIRTRGDELLPGLIAHAESVEEIADGYRLRFGPSPGVLSLIAQVIDAERQCCRFLRFTLTVEADSGPVWLELTGPPGTQAFLNGLGAKKPETGSEIQKRP
jgi:hypothetical protein